MATVPEETDETAIGVVREWWIAPLDHLESIVPWLVITGSLIAYGGLHVVFMSGAMIAAVYLTIAVPGMAGFVVFFIIGIPLVVAGRLAAHRLFVGVLAR